jgi:hypothetical protein
MKLTTKKIIAREFLALLLVISIGLTAFLSIYPYNAFKEKRISRLSNEINTTSKQIYSLSFAYNKKLQAIQNSYNLFVKQGYNKNIDTFKSLISKNPDALNDSYNIFVSEGYTKSIDDYKKLMGIDHNRISERDNSDFILANEKKTIIANLDKENKETKKSKLSYHEQLDFTYNTILLLCIFIFGFRYLFYGVKWSFRILKEKVQ